MLTILSKHDPLTNVFLLLMELGEHKDAGVVRDVALRVLETEHDWDSISECLRLWPMMLPWANEFLQRMYRRVDEVSTTQPLTDINKINSEIERISKIYWTKHPKAESKSITNEALKDYLIVAKQQNSIRSLPPFNSTVELKLPELPQPPK